MQKIKNYFNLENADGYKFEWNDLRALLQLVNVILIVFVNVQTGSLLGLAISTFGLIKDLTDKDRRINGIVIHLLGMFLNVFCLWWF